MIVVPDPHCPRSGLLSCEGFDVVGHSIDVPYPRYTDHEKTK